MEEYQINLSSLKRIFGVPEISMWTCEHLAPYYTRTIKYVLTNLVSKYGTDGEILDYIKELERVWDYGADKIVHEKTTELANEVLDNDFIASEYDEPRFVFCWTGLLAGLLERLRIQYWDLLHPKKSNECPCCCAPGENQKTWENYKSDVLDSGGCLCRGRR